MLQDDLTKTYRPCRTIASHALFCSIELCTDVPLM